MQIETFELRLSSWTFCAILKAYRVVFLDRTVFLRLQWQYSDVSYKPNVERICWRLKCKTNTPLILRSLPRPKILIYSGLKVPLPTSIPYKDFEFFSRVLSRFLEFLENKKRCRAYTWMDARNPNPNLLSNF